MNSRKTNLLNARPIIASAIVTPHTSINERFQNQTLRPIIKLSKLKSFVFFVKSIKLVKPISYSINLFHGFEWFLTYPKFIKDQIINFNFLLKCL